MRACCFCCGLMCVVCVWFVVDFVDCCLFGLHLFVCAFLFAFLNVGVWLRVWIMLFVCVFCVVVCGCV